MRSDISVHDNHIYAFTVHCEERRLVLHTAYRDREPHEFTDVVFRDVVAHLLEHVLPGNILFGIEERDVESLVQDEADLFAESWRWGWPPVEYDGNLETLVAALRQRLVRAYLISSSYGLSGWVLAGSCNRVAREAPATLQ
jgi:hypothetical protein